MLCYFQVRQQLSSSFLQQQSSTKITYLRVIAHFHVECLQMMNYPFRYSFQSIVLFICSNKVDNPSSLTSVESARCSRVSLSCSFFLRSASPLSCAFLAASALAS